MTRRPFRSVLFMPGANARALDKSRGLPADALIFDLEDAVAPDAKVMARHQAVAAAKAGGYGRRTVLIRINDLSTPWGPQDLLAVAASGADGVVLPKVERAAAVREVEAALDGAEAPSSLAIWCMIETPRGVLRADEIAQATPRIQGLVMGTSDLSKDLGVRPTSTRLPLLTSLGHCLLAARAAGLVIVDGVHVDLADEAGLAASCQQGVELGFDGKTVIHPKQIAAANAAFSPSPEEIAWARTIRAAHDQAEREGRGVVVVDGKMIERLHVEQAERRLALAEAIDAMKGDPEPAQASSPATSPS